MPTTDRPLYEAFFQKDADYYVAQLDLRQSKKRLRFNSSCFELGWAWFFERKLYKTGFIVLLFSLMLIVFAILLLRPYFTVPTSSLIILAFLYLTRAVFGLFATRIYLMRAQKVIAEIKSSGLSYEEMKVSAAKHGGFNKNGILYFNIGLFLTVLIVMYFLFSHFDT